MPRQASKHASVVREEAGGTGPGVSRLLVVVSCIAAIGAMAYGFREPNASAETTPEIVTSSPEPVVVAPSDAPTPTAASATSVAATPESTTVEEPTPSPAVPHVGIVAGHWGHDEGAICPDGLTEVEINLDVAKRVAQSLRDLGYQVDLLEEYDSRLQSYWADALISIHADSCEAFPNATPPASGFKVASVEDSLVPEEEQRLVACMAQCYADRTGMYFHANSITYDMTRYHSFYEIDGRTPGAIIETGFMYLDREMLTQRPDLVAQGIVDGIVCFVEGG